MPAPKGNKFALGHHFGRPKEYTKEFIENEAKKFYEWMQKEDSIWYEQFCVERGYCADYIARWAEENEDFRRVYEYSQSWQKVKLIQNGLLMVSYR
jgi:hypothetical protein